MAYVALARKYRPRVFEDFVGQEVIARTLKNAIAADKVSHAYLFCGSRGTGKTSMARVFATALNCQSQDTPTTTPCGECEICRDVQAGMDLDVQELDGASNGGIEQVRALRENVRFVPTRARYRIYYIDEAHMLTLPAFNALLKTLEEPPPHVKFILSTTAPSKLPETIHSRCQRFDFRRISAFDIAKRLRKVCEAEGFKVPDEVLSAIGRRVRGSMRDGLSLLDQVVAFSDEELTVEGLEAMLGGTAPERLDELLGELAKGNVAAALRLASQIVDSGCDVPDLLEQLAGYARTLLIAAECGLQPDLLERAKSEAEALVQRSKAFSPEYLMYAIQTLYDARQKTRMDLDGRMVMELALVNLARAHTLGNIEEMLSRLESVEARLQGRPAPAGSAAPTMSSAPSPSPEQPAAAAAPPPRTGGADAQVKEQPATSAEPGAYLPHAALWEDLLKAVQENGNTWVHMHLLRGWLKEARPPNGRAPGRLVVAVPDRRVLQELDAPKARAELEKALSRVLKGPVELSFVLDAETRGGLKEKDSAPDEEAARIAEIFGGQVVKRRKAPNG